LQTFADGRTGFRKGRAVPSKRARRAKTPVSSKASPGSSDISTNGAWRIGTRRRPRRRIRTAAVPRDRQLTVQNYDRGDATVGHGLVRQNYAVLYDGPEHVLAVLSEARAVYCRAGTDGTHDGHGRLLVMATAERFVQTFVVEFTAPRSFAVVASTVVAPQPSSAVCRPLDGLHDAQTPVELYHYYLGSLVRRVRQSAHQRRPQPDVR